MTKNWVCDKIHSLNENILGKVVQIKKWQRQVITIMTN